MPITELRIEGLRTIERLRLPLEGLTVLIGENGSGKSSIIEACELLRRAAGGRFMDEFYGVHGGLTALLRQGATKLRLGITVHISNGSQQPSMISELADEIYYDLELTPNDQFTGTEETLSARRSAKRPTMSTPERAPKKVDRQSGLYHARPGTTYELIKKSAYKAEYVDSHTLEGFGHQKLFLDRFTPGSPVGNYEEEAALQIANLLRGIRVHLPFEVTPAWAARALDRKSALRSSALFAPAPYLEKLGLNLANTFQALKNSSKPKEWQKTLDYIRLGLGERIEDVITWPDPGGGNIGLSLKYRDLDRPIPTAQLSDGTLAYLAFVALFRQNATRPSLLAMDEPDLHLHPHLLMRVLDFFETMAKEHPVLLATHSDRLLDGLSDPARSVVLCELDENHTTRLVRPDREALDRWLERYRGLGDIRSAGHAASVLTKVEPAG